MSNPLPKPMGWLVGLGVLLITLGVIAGLVTITMVERKKQRYRIEEQPPVPTNQIRKATNGTAWIPGGRFMTSCEDSWMAPSA